MWKFISTGTAKLSNCLILVKLNSLENNSLVQLTFSELQNKIFRLGGMHEPHMDFYTDEHIEQSVSIQCIFHGYHN